MKKINISNDKKRDAVIGLDNLPPKPSVKYALENGKESKNIKVLRGTLDTSIDVLKEKYSDLVELGKEIIHSDPEVDTELFGRIMNNTRRLYLDDDNQVVYSVQLKEIVLLSRKMQTLRVKFQFVGQENYFRKKKP